MTTFSQLVDDVVAELLRPDLLAAIAQYTNQSVREIHFKPNVSAPVLFDANRIEDLIPITTDDSFLWPIPSATRFQDIEAIYLPDPGVYATPRKPMVNRNYSTEPGSQYYWYRTGPQIAISGVVSGWNAMISYFMYPQTHAYKVSASRLIQYNVDLDTYTLIAGGGAPSQSQLDSETNWVLQRWGESVIKEGVRAKTFKRIGDEGRARMAFSAFQTQMGGIWLGEPSSG